MSNPPSRAPLTIGHTIVYEVQSRTGELSYSVAEVKEHDKRGLQTTAGWVNPDHVLICRADANKCFLAAKRLMDTRAAYLRAVEKCGVTYQAQMVKIVNDNRA